MLLNKKLLTSAVAASVLAAGISMPAHAELSGSVGVASTYLWRGYDLGSGTPAVSGDLSYSAGGAYGGIWGSSGDTVAGSEFDLYVGYGISFGQDDMFSVDISAWTYTYPGISHPFINDGGEIEYEESSLDTGKLSEVVLSFGAGPVALTIYDNVAGGSGYRYYTLSGGVGDFSATVGMHDTDGEDTTHLDVSYAYNDNLSFTLSQQIQDEDVNDDLKFVVGYSLPLGE